MEGVFASSAATLPSEGVRTTFDFLSQFFGFPSLVDKRSRKGKGVRISLERLEDRLAPTTYIVNSVGDTGQGQDNTGDLRYCINQLNATGEDSNTIVWERGAIPIGSTISLQSALPTITKNVSINCPGGWFTIKANATGQNLYHVFGIASSATVKINSLTLTGGDAGSGGCIYNTGILYLNAVTVKNNTALQGGGIFNASGAKLYLQASGISYNIATNYGGGIANFGGVVFTGASTNGITNNNVIGTNG